MGLCLAIDTGGTFTDLVVLDEQHELSTFKCPSTPNDPIEAILDVLELAAAERGQSCGDFLGCGEFLIYATTHALNAVLTKAMPRTALLITEGHQDVLLMREGGRVGAFDFTQEHPRPYVPRSLTLGIRERVGAGGEIVLPLDEESVVEAIARIEAAGVEAVAVCLLWSIANPEHEQRVGHMIRDRLPGVALTLSHELNPSIREFRRASSAVLDASLKPLMSAHLRSFQERVRTAGFEGRMMMVTSSGALLDVEAVALAPIHALNSGPSMAPVGARFYAARDVGAETVIVIDAGGTSLDVSLVRQGVIPRTRETWINGAHRGMMTGFPSVDVRSVGAGGGSIAWVDQGGLLHVGPASAGSRPGPVCYGRGGQALTVTDAALVLGYLDATGFLGGAMRLDQHAAECALNEQVAAPLGLALEEAAAAVMEVLVANMVAAIEEITVGQGVDPRKAVLVGGGGAAGLTAVSVARGLGCPRILVPETGATLSAAGALLSDLAATFQANCPAQSDSFDYDRVNAALSDLRSSCLDFIQRSGGGSAGTQIQFFAEARYPRQVWELEVPLREGCFAGSLDVETLCSDFHALHERVFAVNDPASPVEIAGLGATATCPLDMAAKATLRAVARKPAAPARRAYFAGEGFVTARVSELEMMSAEEPVLGPAIVESAFTTIIIGSGAACERLPSGALSVRVDAARPRTLDSPIGAASR